MKMIITGKKGYIASNLYNYLTKKGHSVSRVSLRDTDISLLDMSGCDVVIHCAALVHKKEKNYTIDDYMNINCRLTKELAEKAKASGVGQFIFLSTMSVYGMQSGIIDENTEEMPVTFYGKSKLAAEKELEKLSSDKFKIAVIRPPMVYGADCPGNYARLSEFAKKTFVFPYVENKRSMIYIENLCEFISLCAEHNSEGIFLVQNREYVSTMDMVRNIKKKGIYYSKFMGKIVSAMKFGVFAKLFGDLYYVQIPYFEGRYLITGFKESIERSERTSKK
ncbi:MAG: NAD-dependent epimerase/dehydratase family protein [Firmicutes bacterium]|nr:NAD-dependent epimerase/dehydratase family protein [Bacillota bacterium]